jgi:hypothetical protein
MLRRQYQDLSKARCGRCHVTEFPRRQQPQFEPQSAIACIGVQRLAPLGDGLLEVAQPAMGPAELPAISGLVDRGRKNVCRA